MRSELKPCPFCGTAPTLKVIERTTTHKTQYYYTCENDNCACGPCTYAHVNKGVVTRAWNRRVDK